MKTSQNFMFSRVGRYRSFLIAAAVFCGAFAAQAAGTLPAGYADFGEVVGKVRPALHGSGMGGQLVGGISGREPELLGPLRLWGARTHDWALINACRTSRW